MSDPWSEWQNDDWSASAASSKKAATDAELWQKANHVSAQASVPFHTVEASVAYKPQLKILKRQGPSSDEQDVARRAQAAAQNASLMADQGTSREQRYKEARERLFGSSADHKTGKVESERRTQSPRPPAAVKHPQRQAHGPQGQGFQGRIKPGSRNES